MNYIAHTKDGKNYTDDNSSQLLKVHLKNVSAYAETFAGQFDAGEVGAVLGILHDLGKYQRNFQDRIRGSNLKVDHATLGAKKLIEEWGDLGRLFGMIISGHHTGLKDSGVGSNFGDDTYSSRINNYIGQEIDCEDEIDVKFKVNHKKLNCDKQSEAFALATYIKMLFSSLVDADWTDTEEYMKDIIRTGVQCSIEELKEKLKNNMPKNDGSYLNTIRAEILSSCLAAAQNEQGLFTLTVPTGGGKTLSSLAFALEHAFKHNLRRVIYVIPYTSIIEQNADVISKCLGKNYVLEHHSNSENNINNDGIEDHDFERTDEQQRFKWASENWDIPIILTTNVQFFESFFSNKPSKTRKLHNITNSVVIFDEAQMLPRELLSPSMYAISELVMNYRVTAVLCSATQPTIGNYKYNSITTKEIIINTVELFNKLKRVEYEMVGKKDDYEILELLENNDRVLCVVNSRKHASVLYTLVKNNCNGSVYHLSTLMHAMHRRQTLKIIKDELKMNKNIIVISTSLIEAGVDIDFPVVVRSIAGIDSIIQAGGRANREGKLNMGKVLIFEPTSEDGKIPKGIQSFVSITKEVIEILQEKAFDVQGIEMYFKLLYRSSGTNDILDMKNILSEFELINNNVKLNFQTAANKYKIIDDNTYNIIINTTDESKSLVSGIRRGVINQDIERIIQQYSVSVYENEYIRLLKDNAVEVLKSGHIVLNNTNYYNDRTGLDLFCKDNKNAECKFI